jgi:hypothetical protein
MGRTTRTPQSIHLRKCDEVVTLMAAVLMPRAAYNSMILTRLTSVANTLIVATLLGALAAAPLTLLRFERTRISLAAQ